MYDVVIVGAGAAGLMAAVSALEHGHKVLLVEKMRYAGKKLLITGKGRCNITNACDKQEFLKNIPVNGKFFNSSFYAFSNEATLEWFNNHGLPTKIERGLRAFPVSDKAVDVRDTLIRFIEKKGGEILYNSAVKEVLTEAGCVVAVKLFSGRIIKTKHVILATGGASYAATGSDGYGYKLAEELGHSIETIYPALVPLECEFTYGQELQGLSLKNVTAKLKVNDKLIGSEFGEMLFAHFGLTGPIILSLSTQAAKYLQDESNAVEISIDLKPALDNKTLEARLQKELQAHSKKQINTVLKELMPNALINTVLDMAFVPADRQASQISKQERQRILDVLKNISFSISGTRPFAEAIVTAGGVNTKEINPKTMQSKLVEGLYFAGEIVDLNAYTGGFNLQIAFSTGYVAGMLN